MDIQTARSRFTNDMNEIYQENISVDGFFASIANVNKTSTYTVSLEIERNLELIAADVLRGADPNENEASLMSEKLYKPPYYFEQTNFTQMDGYDRMFGKASNITPADLAAFTEKAARQYQILANKINRAIERQGAQAFDTGIVTMNNGDNIDFKRTATSKPDIGATDASLYWGSSNGNPKDTLNTLADYIRQVGKSKATEFNVFMGETAFNKFFETAEIFDLFKNDRPSIVNIQGAMEKMVGATAKGYYAPGTYHFNVFIYKDTYDVVSGSTITPTYYWDQNKIFMFPATARISLNYAGLPVVFEDGSGSRIMTTQADILLDQYIDTKKSAHYLRARSAPLYTLVSIDQIASATVVGASGEQG